MKSWMIVNTDNYGGDYPDENIFVDGFPTKELAEKVADAINKKFLGKHSPRYYKVEDNDYKLQPGFEP